jgi:hypothetical protein
MDMLEIIDIGWVYVAVTWCLCGTLLHFLLAGIARDKAAFLEEEALAYQHLYNDVATLFARRRRGAGPAGRHDDVCSVRNTGKCGA